MPTKLAKRLIALGDDLYRVDPAQPLARRLLDTLCGACGERVETNPFLIRPISGSWMHPECAVIVDRAE